MTREEFKTLHKRMLDSKTHLCGAVLDDDSMPMGMHGDAIKVVALAVRAIIMATQSLPEVRRLHLRVMAIAKLSSVMAEKSAQSSSNCTEREGILSM